jgi:hypothetical protein
MQGQCFNNVSKSNESVLLPEQFSKKTILERHIKLSKSIALAIDIVRKAQMIKDAVMV